MNRGYNIIIKISSFFTFYSYKPEFYLDIVINIKERKVSNIVEQL